MMTSDPDNSDVEHLDGVPWHSVPAPPRRHRCWVQTRGWIGFSCWQRCGCGAISEYRGHPAVEWDERNSRSDSPPTFRQRIGRVMKRLRRKR